MLYVCLNCATGVGVFIGAGAFVGTGVRVGIEVVVGLAVGATGFDVTVAVVRDVGVSVS